jgi:D-tyrosyl-tRNA(Tyr) deacylase
MNGTPRSAIYFFCTDLNKDPVGPRVYDAIARRVPILDAGWELDGLPVGTWSGPGGDALTFVRTQEVLSHDYGRYLAPLCERLASADLAALVNWHQGGNAPPSVLTVHTTGDIPSGIFGPADPRAMRTLLLALEARRVAAGLDRFSVQTEGTHWSGIAYGRPPQLLAQYPVPLMDVEIGSYPNDWADPGAIQVLAEALLDPFGRWDDPIVSLLCGGGVHFEPGFFRAVLDDPDGHPFALSHILPNQWFAAPEYEGDSGVSRLRACAASITGGIRGIVYHDKLKGTYKEPLRRLAAELGVPVFSHKRLRRPDELAELRACA